MARSGIFILSALFILTIGWSPCESTKCTEDIIDDCFYLNLNDNDCKYSKREVACLKAIDQSNCTDWDREQLGDALREARLDAAECPGLPDGTCYFNAMVPCEKDIPFKLAFLAVDPLEEKQLCKSIKGKEEDRRQCFKSIKPKCTAQYVLEELDENIEHLDTIEKKCAKY